MSYAAVAPAGRSPRIATCMRGFPLDRLREIAMNTQAEPGFVPARPTDPAAMGVTARMAWTCQLQFTAP